MIVAPPPVTLDVPYVDHLRVDTGPEVFAGTTGVESLTAGAVGEKSSDAAPEASAPLFAAAGPGDAEAPETVALFVGGAVRGAAGRVLRATGAAGADDVFDASTESEGSSAGDEGSDAEDPVVFAGQVFSRKFRDDAGGSDVYEGVVVDRATSEAGKRGWKVSRGRPRPVASVRGRPQPVRVRQGPLRQKRGAGRDAVGVVVAVDDDGHFLVANGAGGLLGDGEGYYHEDSLEFADGFDDGDELYAGAVRVLGPAVALVDEYAPRPKKKIPANVTFAHCDHAVHETCLATVGAITWDDRGRSVAAKCPVCHAAEFAVDVDQPMHYALRPQAAAAPVGLGKTKHRRNHHAQSKVPQDANGFYPCLRKCGRVFGHAPAAIAHTKTCKYEGAPLVAADCPPRRQSQRARAPSPPHPPPPAAAATPPYNPRVRVPRPPSMRVSPRADPPPLGPAALRFRRRPPSRRGPPTPAPATTDSDDDADHRRERRTPSSPHPSAKPWRPATDFSERASYDG
ncbi:hypothetical protein JL720_4869 [Aureococcus anophagefferens]|nr:hypothetical protein JL720_4869 [Aureococcus anophagefferens]